MHEPDSQRPTQGKGHSVLEIPQLSSDEKDYSKEKAPCSLSAIMSELLYRRGVLWGYCNGAECGGKSGEGRVK